MDINHGKKCEVFCPCLITVNSFANVCTFHQSSHGTDSKLNGSIFWFSVPAILPDNYKNHTRNISSHSESKRVKNSVGGSDVDVDMIGIKNVPAVVHMIGTKHVPDVDWQEEVKNESKHYSPKHSISAMEVTTPLSAVAEPPRTVGSKQKDPYGDRLDHTPLSKADNPAKRRKKYALIIDDSKTIRKVLERALSNFGFEVKLAENGMQGLEKMKSTVFDIVLCDFLMPIMDGMDCVKQYREWESSHRAWFQQVSTRFVICENV